MHSIFCNKNKILLNHHFKLTNLTQETKSECHAKVETLTHCFSLVKTISFKIFKHIGSYKWNYQILENCVPIKQINFLKEHFKWEIISGNLTCALGDIHEWRHT